MGFNTYPATAREREARESEKRRHSQNLCQQSPHACHWCWVEAQEARTGGDEYEAALKAHFGK